MKQLALLLLEASLELVPPEIATHPSVLKVAKRRKKKPNEIVLDISVHYHAMKSLQGAEKRGRPDIVHVSLLEALESPLNKNSLLRVAVHTLGGHCIFVDPRTRITKNYNRFIGLIEQLFQHGRVPPVGSKPLMYLKSIELKRLVEAIGSRGLILLREICEYKPVHDVVKQAVRDELAVGIGAFPHGDFSEKTAEQADYCYSIYREPLTTFVVVSRTIASAERAL
ncbi:MAG: 16S rRNA methyltransferase, partial [Desulfurococcaceae archaeon]